MRLTRHISLAILVTITCTFASAQTAPPAPSTGPYKIINNVKVGGTGGFDYVFADSDGRRLYIPRSSRVEVYDLDTLKSAGTITPATGVHGAAIDPKSNHGFCSSNPVVMWDTQTLKTIKTIPVTGNPDGILFDPYTQHVHILSHSSPNVTVIDTTDGTVLGTIDLGGPPEQGASDGSGKLYISIEVAPGKIAVVDSKAMKVTATYDLVSKGGQLAGLALDTKNHILFASGRTPPVCVIMNADDGKIITTLPIGTGVDASAFNPATMEAVVSTGDGLLTVIKENSPTDFVVEQSLTTKPGAKTCTLDSKTGQILLITADRAAPAPAVAPTTPPTTAPAAARGGRGGGRGGATVPDSFQIIVVGK